VLQDALGPHPMVPADAMTDKVVIPFAFSAQLHWILPDVEGKGGAQPQQNMTSAEHANSSMQLD